MSDAINQLLPSADAPDLVGRRVFELLEAVARDKTRLGLTDAWTRNYRLGLGRTWQGPAQPGVPQLGANLLHLHRQRTVNMLTDNHPTFNVSRVGPVGDEQVFAVLERAAAWWWNEQEQQAVFERSVINGETYGAAVEKVVFDPDLEYGLGEVRTVAVDPFAFGVYPTNCLDIQEAEAVLHFAPMSLRQAARRWPEAAGKLRSDADLLADLGDGRREIMLGDGRRQGLFARFGELVGTLSGTGVGDDFGQDTTLVCECWVRDTEERWISFAEGGSVSVQPIYGRNCRVPARLTVVSGSTMPVSRVQQREEALALYEMGAIDRQELLEKLDWSSRAAVLARMEEPESKNREGAALSSSPAGGDNPPRTPLAGGCHAAV